jgi:hypothetical protein
MSKSHQSVTVFPGSRISRLFTDLPYRRVSPSSKSRAPPSRSQEQSRQSRIRSKRWLTQAKPHQGEKSGKWDPVETGKMEIKKGAERHSLNQRVYPYSSRNAKEGGRSNKTSSAGKVPKSLEQSGKPLRIHSDTRTRATFAFVSLSSTIISPLRKGKA